MKSAGCINPTEFSSSYFASSHNHHSHFRRFFPAVVHFDGMCRVQVVREEIDPVCDAFLKAMRRRVGAEVSVKTSLVWHNVQTEHKDAGEQPLKWKRENELVPDNALMREVLLSNGLRTGHL